MKDLKQKNELCMFCIMQAFRINTDTLDCVLRDAQKIYDWITSNQEKVSPEIDTGINV